MHDALAAWDTNRLRRLRRNLRAWSEQPARCLPWRNVRDPYRVWISEVMLQQTTVGTVVDYYNRFIQRFPTIEVLACASEQEVFLYWEGLGYYSRARNIYRAAQKIVSEYAGRFPDDVDRLQELPGIGRYTAGAIASLAFDERAPVLEANTLRVYARLLGFRDDPRSAKGNRLLWNFAERILPRRAAGRFNQAMMDLGAMLCTPTAPACAPCPIRTCCAAFAAGTQHEIPFRSPKPKSVQLVEAAVAIQKAGRYLLRRCRKRERWAGLWDFPRVSMQVNGNPTAESSFAAVGSKGRITSALRQTVEQGVREQTGTIVELDGVVTEIRHSVTHYRIRLICCVARHRSGRLNRTRQALRWVSLDRLGDYPLPMTGRKFARLLKNHFDRSSPSTDDGCSKSRRLEQSSSR